MNPSSERRCAACDAPLPDGAQFCIECGQPVDQPATGPTQQLREREAGIGCPTCGATNPDYARYCVACGRPLETEAPAPSPAPRSPSAHPAPPPRSRTWKPEWSATGGAVFLIGLAVLFLTGWWWPGIMVLLGIVALINSIGSPWGWASLQGAFFLFGIAVLAYFNWWWPGILVLIGLQMLLSSALRRS